MRDTILPSTAACKCTRHLFGPLHLRRGGLAHRLLQGWPPRRRGVHRPSIERNNMTNAKALPRLASGLVLLAWGAAAFAHEDAPNSKDHPLLTRYPNSHIVEYEKNFNSAPVRGRNPGWRAATQGGRGRRHDHHLLPQLADKQPSPLQVIRNYQNAMKADRRRGGLRAPAQGRRRRRNHAEGDDGRQGRLGQASTPASSARPRRATSSDRRGRGDDQVVSANQLLDELNKNGFIALYINFDTGKADLKAGRRRHGEGDRRT